jgi:glycosyltransferase involved in cell wall biosynthesis
MRLLHLTSVYAPQAFGGAERVVQTLAEHQAEEGWTVGVAHLVPQRTPQATLNGVAVLPLAHRNPLWLLDSARYPGPVRKVNKLATIYNVLTARDFAQVLDSFAPDVLHSHSMAELTPWMWAAARRRGIPIVHTLHDYDLLCIRTTLFKDGRRCETPHRSCRLLSAVKRRCHAAIGQVVGVSQAILDVHRGHGLFAHLPAAAQHVIWNPVVASPPAIRPAREGVLTFGFLGRLVPEKGIDILLEACRRLGPGAWQLRIGGRPPADDADLRARAAGLPIVFDGYVNPAAFLREIDMLVAPMTWCEPFGLTVVEALSAGVPVLGSDLGGVGEIIRAVDAALLVPAGDAAALAARMAAIIAAGRGRLAAAPDAAAVRARTDPQAVARAYRGVYALAAGSASRGVAEAGAPVASDRKLSQTALQCSMVRGYTSNGEILATMGLV